MHTLKLHLIITVIIFCQNISAQSKEETAPLPNKFDGLEKGIDVSHYPSPVYASIDPDDPYTYCWKHNTTLLSEKEEITVLEGGAYIFYNDKWNLRVEYDAKDFCKLFKIKNQKMKAGEPYTFPKNWRKDKKLYGGWAMWYVIGKTKDGKKVFGIGKLDTVGELYPKK